MKKILTILMISAMALTACSRKIDLNGEWKITSVGTESIQTGEAAPTLSFNTETGRIHGYTGVNVVNGEYEYAGRKLTLSGLGVTMMAGPEEDMKLERSILDAFAKISSVKQSEERELLLLDKEGDIVMTLQRR